MKTCRFFKWNSIGAGWKTTENTISDHHHPCLLQSFAGLASKPPTCSLLEGIRHVSYLKFCPAERRRAARSCICYHGAGGGDRGRRCCFGKPYGRDSTGGIIHSDRTPTVLMVAKEKKKMEAGGDIPERRKDNDPPIVSEIRPSKRWLYRAPKA